MTRTIPWVLLAIAASAVPAAATPKTYEMPGWSSPLDDATEAAARKDLMELAAKQQDISPDLQEKVVEGMMAKHVIATSRDTGCPGVDVDIVNASAKVIWNIAVTIEQKDTTNRTDSLHIPFMPPRTMTRITVPCVQDYSYGSPSYSAGGGIRLSYDADGQASLAEALPKMIAEQADFEFTGYSIKVGTQRDKNMLAATLATVPDRATAHDLVMAIAKTGIGTKELGAVVAQGGTLEAEVVASMSSLPREAQAQLGRTLIASPAAGEFKDKLGPMIETQLCTGARKDVLALWLRAQKVGEIPDVPMADRVKRACKPNAGDAAALAAAVAQVPEYAAALDSVDPALFAAVVAKWKAIDPDDEPTAARAYLRLGGNAERFGKTLAALPHGLETDSLDAIVRTPEETPADAVTAKAQVVTAFVGKASETGQRSLVSHLYDALLEGSIRAPAMRDAVKDLKSFAPDAANESVAKFGDSASKVFDPSKLTGAKIELTDFLAFNAEKLGTCTAGTAELQACVTAIAGWQQGVLVPIAQQAARPTFLTEARTIVGTTSGDAQVALGKAVLAAGFDEDVAVGVMCTMANNQLDQQLDPTELLDRVAQIVPKASCISALHDQAASNHHKAIALAIVAILGICVPLPASGFWLRRKWRKVKATLPETLPPSDAKGVKLDDKLGGASLGRGLRAGIMAVMQEVPGAAGLTDGSTALLSETVRRAVKTGDAATLLQRVVGGALYFVALPLRDPRPQAVQRYLGDEWPPHLAAIQRSAGAPVTALVVFCGPDATEATLLAATNDGTHASDPEALLDARDARERHANGFRHVITLGEG